MVVKISLFAAGLAVVSPASHAEDLSALLKAKTQAFSEAGQRGDGKTMADLLDEHVVFVNESGDMPTKQEIVESAQPPALGVRRDIAVTDWSLTPHGTTAVARFVDVVTQKIGDQTIVSSYLSTEAWQKKKGRWLMISSQTLALQQDPPAIVLPVAQLDEYVGTYSMAQGLVFQITRDGDRLLGKLNDAEPAEMKVEARDVLFTPGMPRLRRVFQRDAAGHITGFASRREGRDLMLTRLAP
jgi:hypothetical protein